MWGPDYRDMCTQHDTTMSQPQPLIKRAAEMSRRSLPQKRSGALLLRQLADEQIQGRSTLLDVDYYRIVPTALQHPSSPHEPDLRSPEQLAGLPR